jgi:hypothetical protein
MSHNIFKVFIVYILLRYVLTAPIVQGSHLLYTEGGS